jgi:hypothetical protein
VFSLVPRDAPALSAEAFAERTPPAMPLSTSLLSGQPNVTATMGEIRARAHRRASRVGPSAASLLRYSGASTTADPQASELLLQKPNARPRAIARDFGATVERAK